MYGFICVSPVQPRGVIPWICYISRVFVLQLRNSKTRAIAVYGWVFHFRKLEDLVWSHSRLG